MKNKFRIILLVFLAIAVGFIFVFGWTKIDDLSTFLESDSGPVSIDESREVAINWIINHSPTYTYDGSDLVLVSEEEVLPQELHLFTFSFTSSTAGYGNRSDQVRAQVITPHTIEIMVEDKQVISAVTDGTYDELEAKIVEEEVDADEEALTPGEDLQEITEKTYEKVPETLSIELFFVEETTGEEQLVSVKRNIPHTLATAQATVQNLLKGPTEQEQASGLSSYIPNDVFLREITIEDGVAIVDFSEGLDKNVAGSAMVTTIRQQIEQTLLQFENIDEVVISVDGQVEGVLQP